LIDANAIPARFPGFLRETPHVVGFCASLEAMEDQDGRVFWWGGLPMTFCEKTGFRGNLKNPVLCWHSGRKTFARPPTRDECHAVRAMKPGMWNKRLEHHLGNIKHGQAGSILVVAILSSITWDSKIPGRGTSDCNLFLRSRSTRCVLSALQGKRLFDR
jgi:hypothetical protein